MPRIEIEQIGFIRSPFKELAGMPIQPVGAAGIEGTVEIFPEFAKGLKDINLFSHIYLIYQLHKAAKTELEVVPFIDTESHGIFATRSPLRPSRIGISIVRLLEVEDNILRVSDIDILDGTPLLDIKPYIINFDHRPDASSGWMKGSGKDVAAKRSDSRFL